MHKFVRYGSGLACGWFISETIRTGNIVAGGLALAFLFIGILAISTERNY